MTKRQALEITRDMWDWLSHNPDKQKPDWPGMEAACDLAGVATLYADCACCQFVGEGRYGVNCDKCPMIAFWPRRCYNRNDSYFVWKTINPSSHTGRAKRAEAAKKIADGAREELRKLDVEEQKERDAAALVPLRTFAVCATPSDIALRIFHAERDMLDAATKFRQANEDLDRKNELVESLRSQRNQILCERNEAQKALEMVRDNYKSLNRERHRVMAQLQTLMSERDVARAELNELKSRHRFHGTLKTIPTN